MQTVGQIPKLGFYLNHSEFLVKFCFHLWDFSILMFQFNSLFHILTTTKNKKTIFYSIQNYRLHDHKNLELDIVFPKFMNVGSIK